MSADRLWPSDAWNLYQSHPDQHKVNFTLLLQPGYWFHGQEAGSNETWPQVRTPERLFQLRCLPRQGPPGSASLSGQD